MENGITGHSTMDPAQALIELTAAPDGRRFNVRISIDGAGSIMRGILVSEAARSLVRRILKEPVNLSCCAEGSRGLSASNAGVRGDASSQARHDWERLLVLLKGAASSRGDLLIEDRATIRTRSAVLDTGTRAVSE